MVRPAVWPLNMTSAVPLKERSSARCPEDRTGPRVGPGTKRLRQSAPHSPRASARQGTGAATHKKPAPPSLTASPRPRSGGLEEEVRRSAITARASAANRRAPAREHQETLARPLDGPSCNTSVAFTSSEPWPTMLEGGGGDPRRAEGQRQKMAAHGGD